MRSGLLPWRCAEWKGPHKQGYVMRWNSQNEVGVSIFNSVTKIHFNKAHDPPRSSSLPPTPSLTFILQLNPGLPGLLQILQGHPRGCSFATCLLPWAKLVLL